MPYIRPLLAMLAVLWLGGCAATQVAIEKKDLKVETQMSTSVFLDSEHQYDPTVFVEVHNSSGREIGVRGRIINSLLDKGYRMAETPAKATYIVQVNIMYVGEADPSALHESLFAGWGGALAGGIGGALIGGAAAGGTGALYGAGIGVLAGTAAELVAGSMVKDVTYTIVTDVQISERLKRRPPAKSPEAGEYFEGREHYKTRIISTANKVNLKFEEALPSLEFGLASSISGIF